MAYMNLLIRYRADLDDTKEQYLADAKEADDWVQKSSRNDEEEGSARNPHAAEQTE